MAQASMRGLLPTATEIQQLTPEEIGRRFREIASYYRSVQEAAMIAQGYDTAVEQAFAARAY